jgi:hypothetical protein
MIIAIDFDGTCTTHNFPNIGKDIGAVPVLKDLVDAGHLLILWTMRSNISKPRSNDGSIHPVGGQYLTEAISWFKEHDIPLWGVQTNPEQNSWTHSPKAYANLYIDDAALGCPLNHDFGISSREFVDWVEVRKQLISIGVL